MKQVIYNGDMGPNITAGGIPFAVGESVTVVDDELAGELLAKPNFSEVPGKAPVAPPTVVKIILDPMPTPAPIPSP